MKNKNKIITLGFIGIFMIGLMGLASAEIIAVWTQEQLDNFDVEEVETHLQCRLTHQICPIDACKINNLIFTEYTCNKIVRAGDVYHLTNYSSDWDYLSVPFLEVLGNVNEHGGEAAKDMYRANITFEFRENIQNVKDTLNSWKTVDDEFWFNWGLNIFT